MISQRQHAKLTADLFRECAGGGSVAQGVEEVLTAGVTSVSNTLLKDAANPNHPASLKIADVIALEAYCGKPVISGFAARLHKAEAATSLLHAISEADFTASDLQHAFIQSTSPDSESGVELSPNEKAKLFAKAQRGLAAWMAAIATLSEQMAQSERG